MARKVSRIDGKLGFIKRTGSPSDPTVVEDVRVLNETFSFEIQPAVIEDGKIVQKAIYEERQRMIVLDSEGRDTSITAPCQGCMFARISEEDGRHPECAAGQTHVYDVRREDMTDPADRGWPERDGQSIRPARESRISLGYRGKNQTTYLVTPTTFMVVAADNPRARKIITDHTKVFESMLTMHPNFNSELLEEKLIFDSYKKDLIDEVTEICITEIRKIKEFNEHFEEELRRQIRRLLGSEDALDQDVTDIVDIDNASVEALNKRLGLKDEDRVTPTKRNDPILEKKHWEAPSRYYKAKERFVYDPELKGQKIGRRISTGFVKARTVIEELPTDSFTFHPHEDIGTVEIRHLCLPVHDMLVCPIARRLKQAMISWEYVKECLKYRIGRISVKSLASFGKGDADDAKRIRYAQDNVLLSNRDLATALARAIGPVRRKASIRSFKCKSSSVMMEALLQFSELDQDLDTYIAGKRQLQALKEMEAARVEEAIVEAANLAELARKALSRKVSA